MSQEIRDNNAPEQDISEVRKVRKAKLAEPLRADLCPNASWARQVSVI